MPGHHAPVMATEVVEKLLHLPDGTYIDATFGRGGHSRALLSGMSATARLIGIDRDQDAHAAGVLLGQADDRFDIVRGRFSEIKVLAAQIGITAVEGVLMDIGVSSPQLDDPSRGFSFRADGPLDMRMDQSQALSAAEWLNSAERDEIAQVLREHGEERFAGRIATQIVRQRPIATTTELAEIIAAAVPPPKRRTKGQLSTKHPATKSFQAIRIFVNQERSELELGLDAAWSLLSAGGRLGIITFHSLEDRVVKQRFKQLSEPPQLPRRLPVRAIDAQPEGRLVGKAMRAGAKEVSNNPRARSAMFRVIEKLAGSDGG
ncbi:MAG: 16S rRNA (cytosine(1402)-N(4))-methyltransferase RsmH [Pseudomonadales bacterium]|nr:16S rRNA (cytosine(1402)-N(4))-methyltransferase RsmH [Pseudomonadales bacterium]